MYIVRNLTDYCYPAIARVFGGRDHTTVIHAVDKISTQMKERRQIYEQVTQLRSTGPVGDLGCEGMAPRNLCRGPLRAWGRRIRFPQPRLHAPRRYPRSSPAARQSVNYRLAIRTGISVAVHNPQPLLPSNQNIFSSPSTVGCGSCRKDNPR